jgi:hypothetical protein
MEGNPASSSSRIGFRRVNAGYDPALLGLFRPAAR